MRIVTGAMTYYLSSTLQSGEIGSVLLVKKTSKNYS